MRPAKKKLWLTRPEQCDYLEERKTDLKYPLVPACASLHVASFLSVDLSLCRANILPR